MPRKELIPERRQLKKILPDSTERSSFSCNLPSDLIREFNIACAQRSIVAKQEAAEQALFLWIATRWQSDGAAAAGTVNITVPRNLLLPMHALLVTSGAPLPPPVKEESEEDETETRGIFSLNLKDSVLYDFFVTVAHLGFLRKQDAIEDAIILWISTDEKVCTEILSSPALKLNIPRRIQDRARSLIAAV